MTDPQRPAASNAVIGSAHAVTSASSAGSQQSRPRILFLAPQPFFTNRGTPLRVLATARALVELGAEVDLLVYSIGESIELSGIDVRRSPKVPFIQNIPIGFSIRKLIVDGPFFLSAWRAIRSRRYAAVHGVEEAGVMAALLSRRYGIPFIFDMHSHMSEQLSERTMRRGGLVHRIFSSIENSCIRRATSVITVADCITERLEQFGRDGVSVTLPDIPVEHTFPAKPSTRDKLVRKLGVENRTRVVYTGNFRSYQGLEILLRGFANFIARFEASARSGAPYSSRRPILLIVGGGPEESDDLERLLTFTRELQISDDVRFVGQHHVTEMSSFMELADVLVSSRSAGGHTPLKIYSYLAAKKPIVATRVTAHTMVLDEQVAFMCDLDPDSMGMALQDATDLEPSAVARRTAMVERGAEVVNRHFSWDRFRERLGDAYYGIIGQDQTGSSDVQHSQIDRNGQSQRQARAARLICLPLLTTADLRFLVECMYV